MLDELLVLILHLQPWFAPLITSVVLIKLGLFLLYHKRSKWSVREFFYFRSSQIVSSSSFDRVSIKIIQNCLSFYALFLLMIYLVVLILL